MSDAGSTLTLTKHHGLGNDFLVVLETDNPGIRPDADLATRLCARHRGIGADGLVYGLDPSSAGADVEMVLFNADGSEAEISGNGIRCLGQAILRASGGRDGAVTVDGRSRRRVLTVTGSVDPNVDLVAVTMGAASEGPALGPITRRFQALHRGTVDIGNPHLVLHVDTLDGIDPADAGPKLEAEYPDGINIHFLEATRPGRITLLHWERGVGVTAACGSGATAAAALAHRWGLVGEEVQVDMAGGSVEVGVGETLTLTGEAVFIAVVEVPDAR